MAGQTVSVRQGGTGQTTPAGARIALGLKIGTNIQAWDDSLQDIADMTGTGFMVRTGPNIVTRTLTGTANEISVAEPNGLTGDPTLSLPTALTFTGKTVTDGTYTGAIKLTFSSTYDMASVSDTNVPFRIGPTSLLNLQMDRTHIQTADNGAASPLKLNFYGGGIEIGASNVASYVNMDTSSAGTSANPSLLVRSYDTGSAPGPWLTLRRASTSPATNDYGGVLTFQGYNNALATKDYAVIYPQFTDVTAGTEDAMLIFEAQVAGSSATHMTMAGGTVNIANVNIDGGTIDSTAVNATTLSASAAVSGTLNNIKARNRIVNPAMQISQENGNTAGTTNSYYGADQWYTNYTTSAGTITTQRVQSVTPNGSKDRYRVTVTVADTSLAAGEYLQIFQPIEGNRVADFRYGGSSAKQSILRFGLKAPAGTYAVQISNSAGNRSYVALFTVSAANTDTEYTLVIPGDTTGTWLTDTGMGLGVHFCFACGSTYQGTTGWQAGNILGTSAVSNGMGTGGNVFELYDVGLYRDLGGTGIPPIWELNPEAFDLWECHRYYRTWVNGAPFISGYNAAGGGIYSSIDLCPPMRTVPTATVSGAGYSNASSMALNAAYVDAIRLQAQITAAGAGYAYCTLAADARM